MKPKQIYCLINVTQFWYQEIRDVESNYFLLQFITVCNEVAKVMFLHVSVILFTVGVRLSACWDPPRTTHTPPGPGTPPPPSRHPQGADTSPQEQTSPEQTIPLGADTPTPILPGADTPPETATVADGTHPTGMHSCFKLILHISFESNHWKLNVFKPKFNEFCTLI